MRSFLHEWFKRVVLMLGLKQGGVGVCAVLALLRLQGWVDTVDFTVNHNIVIYPTRQPDSSHAPHLSHLLSYMPNPTIISAPSTVLI